MLIVGQVTRDFGEGKPQRRGSETGSFVQLLALRRSGVSPQRMSAGNMTVKWWFRFDASHTIGVLLAEFRVWRDFTSAPYSLVRRQRTNGKGL